MNYAMSWGDAFQASIQNLWFAVVAVLPKVILAVLLFIVGWLIAGLVREGIREIFRALKLDKALSSTGLDEMLARAGFTLESGLFVGELLRWFIIVLFLQLSLGIVEMTSVNGFLSSLIAYIPNVVIAGIVIMAGSLVANFVGRLVEGSARATRLGDSATIGAVARYAIWIFVIFAAVSQLQVLNNIIQPLIYGIIAMLALAGGLAFGLGGREAAARMLDKVGRK
jgi:Conserved TM helix